MSRIDTDIGLIRALCEIENGLTEWEVGFVESVAKKLDHEHVWLSEKQREIADRILEEKG